MGNVQCHAIGTSTNVDNTEALDCKLCRCKGYQSCRPLGVQVASVKHQKPIDVENDERTQ